MIRFIPVGRIAATILLGAALAPAAFGQSARPSGPYTVHSGDDIEVFGRDPTMNIVGGAIVRFTGSGESTQMETVQVQATQVPRFVRVVGSGENISVIGEDMPLGGQFAAMPDVNRR